jgi:hypothetical protein
LDWAHHPSLVCFVALSSMQGLEGKELIVKTKTARMSLDNKSSVVVSIRLPRAWVEAFRSLETEEIKQQTLMRTALRRFLRARKALK